MLCNKLALLCTLRVLTGVIQQITASNNDCKTSTYLLHMTGCFAACTSLAHPHHKQSPNLLIGGLADKVCITCRVVV